jgi:hypothetical protein
MAKLTIRERMETQFGCGFCLTPRACYRFQSCNARSWCITAQGHAASKAYQERLEGSGAEYLALPQSLRTHEALKRIAKRWQLRIDDVRGAAMDIEAADMLSRS